MPVFFCSATDILTKLILCVTTGGELLCSYWFLFLLLVNDRLYFTSCFRQIRAVFVFPRVTFGPVVLILRTVAHVGTEMMSNVC